MADVTPGVETSEHAQAEKASFWANILIVVGLAFEVVPPLLEKVQIAFPQATWVGAALAVVGVLAKVWNAIGYGKNRSIVKVGAAQAPPQG